MAEEGDNSQKLSPKIGVLAILVAGGILLLAVAVVRPLLKRRHVGCRGCGVVCGTNVSGLAKSLVVYANDDPQGRLPPADRWCDILIELDFTTPKQFVCKRSDTIGGESSYAINENVAGKSLGQLPDDMVLLFETDFGKGRGGRRELLKNRTWYRTFPAGDPNRKVYKNRWNQAGGPEILTTEHHEGQGCSVAFMSTRVAFVKTADLAKLKWKPESQE